MTLIRSSRHSQADLARWSTLEAFDRRLGATPRIERMERAAVGEMRAFAAAGDCYASVSWGKDSTCIAGLVALHRLPIPMVCLRWPPVEDPDCLLVRDAFLARFRGVEYHEVTAPLRWYRDRHEWLYVDRRSTDFGPLHDAFGERRITGVRSGESTPRRLREKYHGVSTRLTCAPITRWSGVDVFAFLARHDLPVHPAYACSWGGVLDRIKIRVECLDSDRGKAHGSEEWERHYYREERAAIDARREADLTTYAEDLDYDAGTTARRMPKRSRGQR